MKKSLISVIIPFYNEEKYLKRAIQSILNQTYSHIEIILIDDGSEDNSNKVATFFCNINKNCKLFSTNNNGPGFARNLGVQNATGKYLVFLDADDELLPTAIQKMHHLMILNIDLSICMNTMIDSNHVEIKTSKWKGKTTILATKATKLLIDEKLIPTVWGKLFKTEIAQKCTFPNISWKEDDVFMLQYLSRCNQVAINKESLIKIHCRKISLTRQIISIKMIDDIAYSFEKQHQLIGIKKELTLTLIKNQINTFLSLFLIINIDWKYIKDKKKVLLKFQNEINKISSLMKYKPIGYKKTMILKLLKYTKIIGFKFPFIIVYLVKNKQIKQLKRIKY